MAERARLPQPRDGLAGEWDRFIGPGASRAELALILGAGVALPLFVVGCALVAGLEWSVWQYGVAALLALDLGGGVAANATLTTGRWYHREGQGFRQHMGFVVAHVHPLVVAWIFRGGDWVYGVGLYGVLLLVALIVLRVPVPIRRPVSVLVFAVIVLLEPLVFPASAGMAWFVPVFFLKLVVGHLVHLEPPAH